MRTVTRSLADRLHDRLLAVDDVASLADAVLAAIPHHVAFDFGCFATTDPASGLVTWAAKTRDLGVGDEEFAASEYGPPDVNQITEIARRDPPVGALSADTGGRPETCRRLREYMTPRFGFTDELRVVFVSRAATWAVLALYRGPGDPPFTRADVDQLAAVVGPVARAVQRCLFSGVGPAPGATEQGPAVLVVGPDDRAVQATPAAGSAVDELCGYVHGSLPENVLAVVATTRHGADHVHSRVRGVSGGWLSVRAALLDAGPDVVVTIEPTPRAHLSRLALAAHGLTAREEDVAALVLQGVDTQGIATALCLSPHTVQDHLKSVFTKLGVTSRREMTARLVLDEAPGR